LQTQEEFIEVGTDTNARDFQARRLNIRVQLKDGTKVLAHTVNDTGITNTRPLIAIMENYQTPDGDIMIPDVLQEYMGKKIITKTKK
jgi:seryl-tRNA synthetase